MAVSTSAAATISITPRPPPPKPNTYTFSTSFTLCKPSRTFISIARNSGDVPAETATAGESGIEVPEAEQTLISGLNVERAMRGLPITDKDYYGLLGLNMSVRSKEVIAGAYRTKVEDVLSQGLEEEEVSKKLELLKEAYRVISSAQERRLYDWSLKRNENPEIYTWPFEVDDTITSQGDPPPQEPEDFGPTRMVGYGFLAWVIFSFIMSIVLNTLN
uniref:Chaperone DnaJ-domain superfamily protein n=1 Tax=Geranium maderense TaxID=28964 RepID=A0A0F7H097_9ROSI